MKDRVCASCGHVGQPIRQCWGSFLVDALLWGCGFSTALMTGIFSLLFIPLAWSIYHILRFNTTKCPQCGDLEMVALDSRKARESQQAREKIKVWKPASAEMKKAA